MTFLTTHLWEDFQSRIDFDVDLELEKLQKIETPVDYFHFYNSVSSVYSSRIEGENIDFDSFFKHKFLNVKYKQDYTQRADDLFAAYEFIAKNELNFSTLLEAHKIISKNLLPTEHRGRIRTQPMFVINSDDRIEYVAASPSIVAQETEQLFDEIEQLLSMPLSKLETFYYDAQIHLVFVKIHPFLDGNGRSARLLEKWFLLQKLGSRVTAIQLEKTTIWV
jgi:Fic family protein